MPGKIKRFVKSKGFKKGMRTAKSAISIAKDAYAIASTVASLINVEFKYVDLNSSLNPSTTGTVLHITQISQGDGVSNRDGNQVKLKSVRALWKLKQNSSATDTVVRFGYIIDTEQRGSAPAFTDIFEASNTVTLPKYDNRKRFIILKDWFVSLADHTTKTGKYHHNFDMAVNWDGTTASDTINNHVYFYYVSNEGTNYPDLVINHRALFIDN